jgi:TonB family protein
MPDGRKVILLNKTTRIVLLLSALVSTASLCFGQARRPGGGPPPPSVRYTPNARKEFTSAEGRFSVLLPGIPTEKVEAQDSPAGMLEVHDFTLQGDAFHGLLYVDYPDELEGSDALKQFLERAGRAGTREAGGTILEEKEILYDGHPGRSVRFSVADGHVMRVRFVVVGRRLYQLGFALSDREPTPAAVKLHDEMAAKYFDSFKIVSDAADTPHPVVREPSAPATSAATTTTDAKAGGEVDRLLKSLPEQGVLVIGTCAEDVDCTPLPGDLGKVAVGRIISKPQPVYPPIAKAARAQGTVTVQFVVDEEGKVIAAQAVSGHPLLQAAAVKAAREALFSPTLLGTKPVKVAGVITYNFVLQ